MMMDSLPNPSSFRASFNYWKLTIFKVVNGWFIVVAGAVCAAGVIDAVTAKWLLCFVAGSKFLEGFMDQEIGKTKEKIQGDTQQFLRSQIKP